MKIDLENAIRAHAFAWLDEQAAIHGDLLEATLLKHGFEFQGQRIPLAVQQGIHKPKCLDAALTIRTSYDSPYSDHFDGEDTLVCSYQGTDPNIWTNKAARLAFEHQLPLIYLHAVGVKPTRYAVVKPVYIIQDDRANLSFRLQTEPGWAGVSSIDGASLAGEPKGDHPLTRSYGTQLMKTRLHQARFRMRVLSAYQQQCAMCRLKHPKLLDAAHITPDSDVSGEPVVSNGLSLCRIHHGAFDVHYLTVEPETYQVRVRPSLLLEEDGPMLLHGIQELEKVKIQLPRSAANRPNPERLKAHWEAFQSAS